MTAFTEKPQIPRIVTKRPERRETINLITNPDIQLYSNSNRQLRYQYLPDFDPDESDEQIEAKLRERFALLDEFTRLATEGRIRALIISGPGGVGKTHSIDKILTEFDPTGEKYSTHSGYSTPVGLLKMLYFHRNENNLLKLDDIDSIFNDEKALNLIKTSCDTTKQRIITYASQATIIDEDSGDTIPSNFEFNGTVIFSTNLDFDQLIDKGSKLSRHFEALMTRSHYVDLMMRTKRDYLWRLFMVADESNLFDQVQGGPLILKEKEDVLTFIEKNFRILRECSLRMALKIGALRKAAKDDDKFSWERMAILSCCRGVR